jgi:hypothetical protein
MSPIGRIFIVLNLVLSAAFLGWAANNLAQGEKYMADLQAEQDAHQATKDELGQEISDLTIEKNNFDDAQRKFREERDQVQSRADNLETQLSESKRRNEQLNGAVEGIQATLADYNSTIDRLSSEKDRAVETAHAAEAARDDAMDAQASAEQARRDAVDAKNRADTRIADLEAERTALQDSVASLETRLQVLVDVTGVTYENILAQPDIAGAVLDVRMDLPPGLVLLNVGSSSNVKRGYTFEIFNGGQYKGQVRVENVQDGMCSALVTYLTPGASIAQGDQAKTRL